MLNVDHACRWIDELAPWLTYVNLYFQGEPLLHPKLDQLIAQCQGTASTAPRPPMPIT